MEQQKKGIRKHYIDNLRNLAILLLFPVHTFMIWNNFGSRFYIWQGECRSRHYMRENFLTIMKGVFWITGNTFLHILRTLVVMTGRLLRGICGSFCFYLSSQ